MIAAVVGAAPAFALDFCSYGVAIVTLALMRSIPVADEPKQSHVGRVLEGLRYARARPVLLGTYLIDVNAMFFAMPLALFPALAREFNGAAVGLFYSMLALGPLLLWSSTRQARLYPSGQRLEPRTFVERRA